MNNFSAKGADKGDWFYGFTSLPWNTYLEVAILTLMVFLGVAGNFKVIKTFLKVKGHFARQIMILYFTLAISDGLICCARIPMIIFGLLSSNWNNSNTLCAAWQLTAAVFGIIIMKNLLVAFQRLIIMYSFPFYRNYITLKSTIVIVMSIWVLQSGFFIVVTFAFGIKISYQNDVVCKPTVNGTEYDQTQAQYIVEGLLGTVPIALTVLCHMKIVWNIYGSGLTRLDKIDEKASYIRINVTSILRSMLLLVCWIPYLVVNMLDPSLVSLPLFSRRYLDYLLCVQSVVSPFITLLDSDFSDSNNRRRSYVRNCVNKRTHSSFRRSLKRYTSNFTSGELRTNRPTE